MIEARGAEDGAIHNLVSRHTCVYMKLLELSRRLQRFPKTCGNRVVKVSWGLLGLDVCI